MTTKAEGFRAIIVGGGVAGLTLANSLERAGISYLLLEGRDEIAPRVGASIATLSNGARILDQLECWDNVRDSADAIEHFDERLISSGNLLVPLNDLSKLISARTGVSSVLLERQRLLQILYDRIEDQSRIQLGKRISRIEQDAHGVSVHCSDGMSYRGDVVAGADGVNSVVRREMWRHADKDKSGFIPEKDKTNIFAEYRCLFGISKSVHGLVPSHGLDVGYGKRVSSMFMAVKSSQVFRFIFEKLDRVYKHDEIPKYSKEDARTFADTLKDMPLREGGSVKFGEVFATATDYTLVPLEEGQYDHWTYGRIVCLGDSIHKMTPNAGFGGNASMESAAVLANGLNRLTKQSGGSRPTQQQVTQMLLEYQRIRKPRSEHICKAANGLTRMHATQTFIHKFLAFYIFPYIGESLADLQADLFIASPMLDFLPPPQWSVEANCPFNPTQGVGKKEWRMIRLLLAIPFFLSFYFASTVLVADAILPSISKFSSDRLYQSGNFSFPLLDTFSHLPELDNRWRTITAAFVPSTLSLDPLSRTQTLLFLTDFATIYAILLIESARRANNFTIALFPSFLGLLGQLLGFGLVSSIFFALFWTTSQIENFKSLDHRLTSMKYTSTVFASMVIGFYIPHFGQYFALEFSDRHWCNWLWQIFPVTVGVAQFVLARTVARDTVKHDRIYAPRRDLPAIAWTIGTCAAVSAGVWVWTMATTPFTLKEIFIPRGLPSQEHGFEYTMRMFLQWDEVFSVANVVGWLVYSFWDLKAAGMVKESWIALMTAGMLGTVLFGPGAAVAAGWGYREWCLAFRRHKDAIVSTWKLDENSKTDKAAVGNGTYAEK
ncbi:FAD-binding domain-containing protein 47 [Elsinoe australis]|uniref:FAD-binding domain-containing protein 47 n=1 Tax=Elsinoe australis TaxID=40998 RepID=A0A4U7ATA7_9PEZI|nr:FAD-binding domain-containing protein 47 [Elsinoe australis]